MNWAAHRHMETIERTDIRWHIGLAIGALCVSASAVLLGLADTTPATATIARSALALPVVAALAFFERRQRRAWFPQIPFGGGVRRVVRGRHAVVDAIHP